MTLDQTRDPGLRSFVPVARDSHFPIQNLPFGVFRPLPGGRPRVGVAIGEMVLDLSAIEEAGLFPGTVLAGRRVFGTGRLNEFLALGRNAWREARIAVSGLLREDEKRLRDQQVLRDAALLRRDAVELLLPLEIGDYTDFYSSREHATNVGTMFRGAQNALMPNWLHVPIAYHGRASSIVVSGTPIRRPKGQSLPAGASAPVFGPSRQLDFELEVGAFVGPGNALGRPVPVADAAEHLFGLVLVNDWSARDVQAWEYQPLGPFLAKNFATSISPWIVTLDALEPFRAAGPPQEPTPLPYLGSADPRTYDIALEVFLETARMDAPQRISATNFRHLYWDLGQQLAHHTVNGCNLRPGDLLASGTISGAEKDSRGSLLELAWRGAEPLVLPGGEQRVFLEDGDRVVMTGWCEGPGYRVGFGEVEGEILPSL
ncbi:MAG: fumarylacetoacetase [Acidobacteria bacterium]|nr:fumarylacetoacetase [Acidobacteriota bacterium]